MKVLHLPTPVAGHPWALAQGERRLGLDSRVLVRSRSSYRYGADFDLGLDRADNAVTKAARLIKAFWSIRGSYDVFHFNFGSSLIHAPTQHLNHLELPFYPRSARLFATYNGCDVRQKYPTMARRPIAACHETNCYAGQCNSGRLDELRRRGAAKMARYVDHIWAVDPDLLNFLPPGKATFLPYASTVADAEPCGPVGTGRVLRIVHAPTERVVKGTAYVLAALDRLKRRLPGAFEVQLVEGLPHEEAVRAYRSADLVIDQLLVGWYGGLAAEVMQLGKPVVSWVAPDSLDHIPPEMARDVREAVIVANAATIEDVVAELIDDRAELRRRAEAGLEYVRRWHDPLYVASLTKAAYEGARRAAA